MNSHPHLLSTAPEIETLARTLEKHEIIAFDTEFIRESTFYPVVEIIQIATDSESWLVDAAAFKKGYRQGPQGGYSPALDPLLEVFRNKKILKILHAAQGDQECLYTSFGAIASPSLDTAIAASLCGLGDGIGLGKLLKSVLDVEIKKGHARTNWSVRPLPPQLEEYAHADVVHLVAVAQKLMEQLDRLGRKQWALELSAKWEDVALYELDIDGITRKLARGGRMDGRGQMVLRELVKWREERVRHLNLPRRWVADDAVLTDLAQVKPKDVDHLSAFRGLNKGELKNSGEAILSAIRRGMEAPVEKPVPRARRSDAPSAEESQLVELLKFYVSILADQHRIAVKHLLTTDQLLHLVRSEVTQGAQLASAGVMSEEAAKLVGDELLALLQGKRAVSVSGSKIRVVELNGNQGN